MVRVYIYNVFGLFDLYWDMGVIRVCTVDPLE
jgi:hypothetical protein